MRWEHWRYTLPLRLRNFFLRARVDRELDEEFRDHVERQTARNVAAGMSGSDARREAVRRMDGILRHKDECRDARGWHTLDTLRRDTLHALRRLRRDWQFSAGAVLILALGIGMNTAIFSLVNTTLFQPRPFVDSGRLVNLYQNDTKTGLPQATSYPAFLDLQNETSVFAGVSAFAASEGRYQPVDAQGVAGGVRAGLLEYANANHLDLLGLQPSLGRWFTEDEDRNGEPVAVLGRTAWLRHFGGDTQVIGQRFYVNGTPVRLIGVAPAALNSSQANNTLTDVWLPLKLIQAQAPLSGTGTLLESRDSLFLEVRARLREGVEIPQARAAMDILARRLANDYADAGPKRGITVVATGDVRVHPEADKRILRPIAAAVLAMVGLVLAVACSNLATLLLVRGTSRSSEVSVRLALGATRWQLIRHLLTESLLLAGMGAAAGVILANWGLRALATLDLPFVVSTALDYRVLGFTIAVAGLCALGFGLSPALHVTRADLNSSLREHRGKHGGSLSLSRRWLSMKNALIVGQVIGSFVLLMAAGFGIRFLNETQARGVGYTVSGLGMLEADPRYAGYDLPRSQAVFEDLKRRIAAIPGVESVFTNRGTDLGLGFDRNLVFGEPGDAAADKGTRVEGRWASPGYFETLKIPLLYGRGFEERDAAGGPLATVVSEAFARRYLGSPNAVGARFRYVGDDRTWLQVVGVAGDTRDVDMIVDVPQPYFYLSTWQAQVVPTAIVARTSGDAAALTGSMQREVRAHYPELGIISAETMEQHHTRDLGAFAVAITFLSVLGGLSLTLAGVGLYAVVAFAVAQRSSELGIRTALGARARDLTWLVVREVTTLVLAGIAIGSALSYTGIVILESQAAAAVESKAASLLGADPLTVLMVAGVIAASGAAAAYIPARRAARTDPMLAIRHS